MTDGNSKRLSASLRKTQSVDSYDGSSSIDSAGASFIPHADVKKAFNQAKIQASLIREDAQNVQDGEIIGATRYGVLNLVTGATGTVTGSTVQNVTVTSQYMEAFPAGGGAGTLYVGTRGEVDNLTVNAQGALAVATNGGTINGGTSINDGVVLVSDGGTLLAGDSNHNVLGGNVGLSGEADVAAGGTMSGVVASGGVTILGNTKSAATVNVSAGGIFQDGIITNGAVLNDHGGQVVGGLISGSGSAQVGAIGIGVPVAGYYGASAVGNIDAGGTFNGTVGVAGTLNIGWSGHASGLTVSGFAVGVNALGGGVQSGGSAVVNVASGGEVVNGQVDGYGTLILGSGASGANLIASGDYGILNGASSAYMDIQGTVTNVTAQKYGTALVEGRGTVLHADAQAGGSVIVSGGFISGATAQQGGEVDAGKNGTIVNASALAGGSVLGTAAGATINGATAQNGGTILVSNGGTLLAGDKDHNVINGTAGYNGTVLALGNGTASDVLAFSRGQIIASAGGDVENATANSGGTILASDGGIVDGGTAFSGGSFSAFGGGTILAGDRQHNVSNAVAGANGTIIAANGGTAAAVSASNGGTVLAFTGGDVLGAAAVANGTIIASAGGDIIGATASANGTIIAAKEGDISYATAGGNGTILVLGGGHLVNGLISGSYGPSAFATVYAGGSATNLQISGAATVQDNGIISGATISAMAGGGVPIVNVAGSGALLNGGTLAGIGSVFASGTGGFVIGVGVPISKGVGATANVSDGGFVSNLNVGAQGSLNVAAGGTIAGGTISGNYASLGGGAFGWGGAIVSGASAVVNIAGKDASATNELVSIFATMNAGSGAVLSNNSAYAGTINVGTGATMVNGAVSGFYDNGLLGFGATTYPGLVEVSGGGIAEGVTVWSSGQLHAENGGLVGGTVYSGGSIWADAGGTVSNATIFSGGQLNSPGTAGGLWGLIFGTAVGTGLVSGASYNSITFESGVAFAFQSGTVSNATVNGGAGVGAYSSDAIVSGATVYGDSTSGGASIDALNGGTVYGATAFSGGLVAAGGVGTININGVPHYQGNNGTSLISGALIHNGGAGIVGGNSNLTITKNGTQVTLEGAGISSDAVVDAGALLDVNSQGINIGGTVAGTLLVESGGTMHDVLFSGAEANGYIDMGGSANSNIVENGGTLTFNGGTGINNTVQAGGEIDVGLGYSHFVSINAGGSYGIAIGNELQRGVLSDTHVRSGGVLSVGGGTTTAIVSGTTTKITSLGGGTVFGATVSPRGTIIIASGASASGIVVGAGQNQWAGGANVSDNAGQDGAIVKDGGILRGVTLENGSGTGSSVAEMGGLIRVEKGATVTDIKMGYYGQIEITDINYAAGESVSLVSNTIYLMSDQRAVWSATLLGSGYDSGAFQVWNDDGHTVIVYDKCFLKGTRILTPTGYVEIENLHEGDMVLAIVNGQQVPRKITGFRHQTSKISTALPIDLAGWSVCVRAGAFGHNLPERDLRVTAEHCFYFEGRFLPIRMLVNDFSIYYDTSLKYFEFFHLETEPHAIICAEGVLTESWLNTEERRQPVNLSNGVTRLDVVPSRNWEKDAAAPLDVSAPFAEKMWQNFKGRALTLGMERKANYELNFDNNPDLRLRLEDGREIASCNQRGGHYFFRLPPGVKGAYLLSKTFRPSESVGPWIDDRRQLGVLVGKIKISTGETFRDLDAHLHAANAQGWDVVENIPCRWTKGNALLPVLGTEEELRHGASLIVEVLAGGPYPDHGNLIESRDYFKRNA